MEFTPKRRRVVVKQEANPLLEMYPHDLNMYKVPPTGEISLVDFQDWALERQKILQLLEITQAQQHKSLDDLKHAFTSTLKKEEFPHYAKLLNAQGCASHTDNELESRRKDHISHFILRLAYSLKDDLQTYFLTHECELFKLRFTSLNREGLTQFLATSGLHYSKISQEFKEENREDLYSSTAREIGDFENTDFYELPFDEVVDLVSDRKVFLNKGVAYVPQSDLMTVFLAHFRSNLAVELNRARRFVLRNLDDERLQIFLKSLPECYSGMSKVVWNTENVPIVKLDELSKTSYPLCMRVMHDHLKTTHHLKNTGRLQYGLFLKGIGVTLEDSIEFWRTELTKKEDTNEDKFIKTYLYHINYNYGKVGRRVNYRPLGCNKLITEGVGPGEVHGCPYKHMDTDNLTNKLLALKINSTDVAEIVRLSSEGHFNLACTKYFESTHRQPPARVHLHPNQYFQESREILSKDEIKEEEKITQEMVTPISPEKILQPIKVKVENNLDIGNSPKTITPNRPTDRKSRLSEKKTPLNIEAMLNDDSD